MGEQENQQQDDFTAIQSAEDFFALLSAWHVQQTVTLEHFLQIPEGTDVQLGDGEAFKLDATNMDAFKAGITMGLQLLGKLPFSVEAVDPEDDDPLDLG